MANFLFKHRYYLVNNYPVIHIILTPYFQISCMIYIAIIFFLLPEINCLNILLKITYLPMFILYLYKYKMFLQMDFVIFKNKILEIT